MVSIAEVGGGVVGLTCALNLSLAGADVVVFDEDAAQGAPSWGNAGHIAVEQVEPLASPDQLRSAAQRLWLFGGPVGFRPQDIGAWGPWLLRYARASRRKEYLDRRAAIGALLSDALPAWRRLVEKLARPDLFVNRRAILTPVPG